MARVDPLYPEAQMPTCAIVRLPLLVEEAPSESTATHSEDDAEVTEDEPEGSDDDAGDYASDEDDVATEPHLIPELKETRISRGYSRRPTKAGNKYIATMSEALARARADFGHDPEYMAKLATQFARFHRAVPKKGARASRPQLPGLQSDPDPVCPGRGRADVRPTGPHATAWRLPGRQG
jgi:hypothetical protein